MPDTAAPVPDPSVSLPDRRSEGGPVLIADPERLLALAKTGLVSTEPEADFDDLARLASQVCGTPVALVSFVDRDRQWHKARVGTDLAELPLEASVCSHALGQTDLLVIPDLMVDPRTAWNPLVTGDLHMRFYAGAPLVSPSGHVLGALCVLDVAPRPEGLSQAQREGLTALARQVTRMIDLRRTQEQLVAERMRLATMLDTTPSFMALLRGPEHVFEVVNPAYRRIVGDRDVVGQRLLDALPEAAEQGHLEILDRVYQTGQPFALKGAPYAARARPGAPASQRHVDFVYQPVRDEAGQVHGIYVEGSDVTDRVRHAERQETLASLSMRLRDHRSVESIAQTAAEVIAHAMGAMRAGIGTVDAGRETILVAPTWCAPGVEDIAGLHHFREYGSYIEALKRGEAVVIPDVAQDPRTEAEADALARLGIRALYNLPVMVHGRLSLVVLAHHAEPHPWSEEEMTFVRQVGDLTEAAIGRAQAEAEQQVLNGEISHRLKNTLAMVQAIAAQTLREVSDRGAVDRLGDRLQALSLANEILVKRSWSAAGLEAVARSVLATFDRADRIRLAGPRVELGPRAALSLSLILHELGTNALKYGALSAPEGQVDVRWAVEGREGGPTLVLSWQEAGGPPVAVPARGGFGSRLIRMGLVGTGATALSYDPEGLRVVMDAPLVQLQQA